MGLRFQGDAATIASQTGGSWGPYASHSYFSSIITSQAFPLSVGFFVKLEGDLRTDYRFNFGEINNGSTAYVAIVYSKLNGGLGLGFSSGASNYYRQLNFNSWHHVCLTYTNSTNRSLYLNGVRVVNQTSPTFNLINISGYVIGINNATTGCAGYQISSLNFFDRALTQTEVFSLANGESAGLRPIAVHDFSSTAKSARGGFLGTSGSPFPNLNPWLISGVTLPVIPAAFNNDSTPVKTIVNRSALGLNVGGRRRLFVVS